MRVIEFEPGYFVTDEGEVWKKKQVTLYTHEWQQLKPYIDQRGYPAISIKNVGRWRIHKLVKHFVDGWSPGTELDHVDGNPCNNHYTNLEWTSHAENCRRGRNAKLTKQQADEIRKAPTGYGTGRALAKKYGVSPSTISAIRRRGYWS